MNLPPILHANMSIQVEEISWGDHPTDSDCHLRRSCGLLSVEITCCNGELGLASRKLDPEAPEDVAIDPSATWERWALSPECRRVNVSPGMPEHPVLVEPDAPFHVMPGAEARLFLRIPVSVVVKSGGEDGNRLSEFPSEQLSQTWFGEIDNGELCYWLPTAAHGEPSTEPDPSGVQAPVSIRNDSREVLQVTRLCLRVTGLAIFAQDGALWSNETTVRYQGGSQPSRITTCHGPPEEASKAELVGQPRVVLPANVVGRSFRSLRKWTAELLDAD